MSLFKNPGRFAGLTYLLISIPGAFALVYVPSKLIVSGNAAATSANITGHQILFQLGIAGQLVSQILFMWVALLLYDLLKGVSQRQASFMLGLLVVSIPIALLNELNSIAALLFVRGPAFLSAFDKPQRDAMAMLFVKLHGQGFGIAGIFWGLWLFPLGLLVYNSGMFPRFLGILLMANSFSYPINSFVGILLPNSANSVSQWLSPLQLGELVFIFWLLIIGSKPGPLAASSSAAMA
jgi:hypothetical protein